METVVQILQQLDPNRSSCDENVSDVDAQLRKYDSQKVAALPDGARVSICRLARAMYTMRNKRSIAHKGDINPNVFDLHLLHVCAQWILTELVRIAAQSSPDEARKIIEAIQTPVRPAVERVLGRTVVLSTNLTAPQEVLILLYDSDPEPVKRTYLERNLQDRHQVKNIRRALRRMQGRRWVVISSDSDPFVQLTSLGRQLAAEVYSQVADALE
ncbi:MAG: hypothetical protein IRY83_16495 [Chloroflexi bacterium]|nr:hypothetical protein [Chloroflexota bacterium]